MPRSSAATPVEIEAFCAKKSVGEFGRALGNATPFLFAFGHLVVGWLWLDMAQDGRRRYGDVIVVGGSGSLAEYFFEYGNPDDRRWIAPLRNHIDLIANIDESIL